MSQDLYTEGFNDGHEKGYRDGFAKGLRERTEEIEQLKRDVEIWRKVWAQLDDYTEALEQRHEKLQDEFDSQIASLRKELEGARRELSGRKAIYEAITQWDAKRIYGIGGIKRDV